MIASTPPPIVPQEPTQEPSPQPAAPLLPMPNRVDDGANDLRRTLAEFYNAPPPPPQFQAPVPAQEPYAAAIAALDERDAKAWGATMRVAITTDPGVAAQADRLARQLGMPLAQASQDLGFLRSVAAMDRMRQDDIRATNPVLFRSMQGLEFARKAWNDYEHLSSFERWGQAWRRGILTTERGRAGAGMWAGDEQSRAEFERIEAELQGMAPTEGFIGSAAEILGQWGAMVPRAVAVGTITGTAAGTANLALGAAAPPTVLGAPLSFAGGFGLGFTWSMVADAVTSEGGNAYASMIQAGYDPGRARIAALGVGLINGALEVTGAKLATKGLGAIKGSVLRRAASEVARDVPTGALRGFLRGYGTALGGEIGTELAQELTNIIAEEMARTGGEDDMNPDGVAARLWEVASKTFQGMAVLGVPAGVAGAMRGRTIQERAKAMQDRVAQGNAIGGASALATNDPIAAADYVRTVLNQGEIQDAFVDAASLVEAMQQVDAAGAASGKLYKSTADVLEGMFPGIGERIASALETGGDVSFSLADVVTRIRADLPEFAAALEPLLRERVDDVAAADLPQLTPAGKQSAEQQAGTADVGTDAERVFYDELRTVQQATTESVYAAGGKRVSRQQAASTAGVYSSMVEQVARAEGLSPSAVADKYGAAFEASETPGRGQFVPDARKILLGPASDVSSALHEMVHWFTDLVAKLDAAGSGYGKEQFDRLLSRWGVTREQWAALDDAGRTPLLEDIAYNAEEYFATGRAPSAELRGLFTKLRSFITTVYRNLRSQLVAGFHEETGSAALPPLDDNLRGFFDRMLASEAAIEQERAVRAGALRLSDATAKALGLDGEALNEIRGMEAAAVEEAKEELAGEVLRGARFFQAAKRNAEAGAKRELKEASDKIRDEVRENILRDSPVHAAVRYIRDGEYQAADGTIQKEDSPQKLDVASVRSALGLPLVKRVAKKGPTLLSRVRQLGGVRMDSYPGDLGKDFRRVPGVFRKNGGESWERIAQQLASEGYGGERYSSDVVDAVDNSWFIEALTESLNGTKVYASEGVSDADVVAAEAEAWLAKQEQGEPGATAPMRFVYGDRKSMERVYLSLHRRRLLKKGGANPDEIAKAFGFPDAEAMLRAIIEAPPLDEAVAARIRQRLEAEEPLSDPAQFKAAVERALNGKAATRLAATLLRAMLKGVRTTTAELQAEAREAARIALLRMPVGSISARAMAAAELRSVQRRDRALASGDLAAAVAAQRQFLVQHYLTVEAARVEVEVERAARQIDQRYGKADDAIIAGRRNLDMVNAGRAILGRFGMFAERRTEDANAALATMARLDPEGYEELAQRIDEATRNAKPWRAVSLDEFRTLVATVDGLWSESQKSEQILVAGRMLQLADVRAELEDQLVQTFGGGTKAGITLGHALSSMPKWVGSVVDSLTRLETWAIAMDGGKIGGPWHRYVYQPLKDAATDATLEQNERATWVRDMLAQFDDLSERVPSLHDYLGAGAEQFKTRADVIGAILQMGSESNFRGFILGNGLGEQVGGQIVTRWGDAMRFLAERGFLKADDFARVQQVWDYIGSELRDRVFATTREVWGFYPKEVEAMAFETPFGTQKGGYYPSKVDKDRSRSGDRRQMRALREGRAEFVAANTNVPRGQTISRLDNVVEPRVLDLGLLGQHINDAINIIHLQPAINAVSRLFGGGQRNTMAGTLRQVAPTAERNIIIPALERMARDSIVAPSNPVVRAIVAWVKRSASAFFLGFNPKNAAQQITGLANAVPVVGWARVWNSLLETTRDRAGSIETIKAKSKAMDARWSDAMVLAAADIQAMLKPSKWRDRAKAAHRAAFFLQRIAQQFTDAVVWRAAYEKAVEELGVDGTALEAEAVRRADSAVRVTQGEKTPLDVPQILSGNAIAQLLTQFADYPNTVLNQNIAAADGQRLATFAWTVLAPSLASTMIGLAFSFGKVHGDDGEDYAKRLARQVFGDQVRGVAGLLPVAGGLAAGMLNRLWGLTNDQGSLRNQPFAAWSVIDSLLRTGAGDGTFADGLATIAFAAGAPARPAVNVVRYQERIERGREPQGGAMDYLRVLLSGR